MSIVNCACSFFAGISWCFSNNELIWQLSSEKTICFPTKLIISENYFYSDSWTMANFQLKILMIFFKWELWNVNGFVCVPSVTQPKLVMLLFNI